MVKNPLGRKFGNQKNPPILSHEFIIQNHADVVSCIAMVFVVGLMLQATSSLASIFIVLGHNVTGSEPSAEHPRGEAFLYDAGWKDGAAVFFYTLICIIMHAILQEYVLDKISKKLHLSKFKLSKFNESGQLVVFYFMSVLWGADVILREQYIENVSKLWVDFPNHTMSFLHKLFFIIQLSYYLHMLPELYFQKVKKDEQWPKLKQSIAGFAIIAFVYFLSYRRIALVLLTLHYFSQFVAHTFQLLEIFDKEEKYAKFRVLHNLLFVITSFATLVLSFLTFFHGISKTNAFHGFLGLGFAFSLQTYLIYEFITSFLKNKRESKEHQKSSKKVKAAPTVKSEKTKKERKKESDLPEADQSPTNNNKKVKTK